MLNVKGTVNVSRKKISRQVTIATDVAGSGAYADGDAVGHPFVLENVVREVGLGGEIVSCVMIDQNDQGIACDVILFSSPFVPTTDNAAFTPSDADLVYGLGHFSISSFSNFNSNQIGTARGIGLGFVLPEGSSIYGQLVARGAPTYGTSLVRLLFTIEQD